MATLAQARAALLNAGTHTSGNTLTPELRDVLVTQGGMTPQQIDSVVQSGDYNASTNAANAGNVGQRTSDYVAQAPSGSVFQQGPAWFYKGADGNPRHITSGEQLQALLAAGVAQVASPLPAGFLWEDVAQQYGQLDDAAVQQAVAAQQQAQQQARQAAQDAQNQQQAQQAQRRQLEQSAMALAAKDGRTFGSLQQSDPNAFATFMGQYGNDLVKAATAWQAEANNVPLPQQQVAGATTPLPGQSSPSQVQPTQTPPQQTPPQQTPVNLGGRRDTPGLRRWMAEHGGSMNGWDALSDAQRAAYESGQSITSPAAPTPATGTTGGPKFQTPWGEADADTPPGNMGLDWWTQWATMMDRLTDDSGIIHDPVTGKPVSNADGSLQRTLTAIDQEFRRGLAAGELTGVYNGANTLDRDKFEEDRTQKLYNRAANPASIFENELARSSGGSVYDTVTGGVNVGQNPASVTPMQSVSAAGQSTQTGTFRTPAIINAYRGGLLTPQAGQINAPNTVGTAQDSVLGESNIRLANQRTNLSPDQRSMVKSFASAGGVSGDQFDYLEELNKPKGRSVSAAVFSGR